MFHKKILCAPTIVAFLLVFSIFPNCFVAFAYAQGVTAELDYTVGADEALDFVEPGDIFKANITVHGFEHESTAVVPFDVMLAIDMSGSMEDNDPDNRRLDAAELFLQLCDGASPTIAGPIRAGIIGFRKEGRVEQGLTDNYSVFFGSAGVIAKMRDQDLGVATNIADAMTKAQQELDTNGIYSTRAVILLTDGRPSPDIDEQVAMIFGQLIPEAITKDFRYYTIGLGPDPWLNLSVLAQLTGGFHRPAATAGALNDIFTEIFEHASHTIIAYQVTCKVRRDTGVARFVPGSFEVPPGIPSPTPGQLTTFGDDAEGWIDINMGSLGNGDVAALSFELEALECLPVDAPEDVIEITPVRYPDSVITYLWGTQNMTYTLEEKSIDCKKNPVFEIEKKFYQETNKVEITLTNNYPHRPDVPDAERTFTNIRVFDELSLYFQFPYYGPSRFFPTTLSPLVDPNCVPPRHFIPGKSWGDLLYWEIRSLGPEESRKLCFRVESRAWAPRDAGKLIPVDAVDPKIEAPPVPDEYIESKVYYDFENQTHSKVIQEEDEWFLPAMLPDLTSEGGRPDLYVEPSLSSYELEKLPPIVSDISAMIPPTGPWPLPFKLIRPYESVDIWVDSEKNGYVANWSHRDGIDDYLENDAFDPTTDHLIGVTGQGDLFKISSGNRIYCKVHNMSTVASQAVAKAYILRQYPRGVLPRPPEWDTIGDAVTIFSHPHGKYRLLYVEIPGGAIERGRHTRLFGTWGGVEYDTATVMIQVSPAQNEAHTSNNTATERFLVVP